MRFRFAAVFALAALTACSHTGSKLMGDPQNPYPLKSPPKIGDIVHLPTGVLVTPEQMHGVASDARIVYVGETHDNPASHRLELQILRALEQRHPGKVALGMEMFVRSQQPVLDRWSAGELDEKSFLKESKWYDNWKMDFDYYRELLLFVREHRIPLIALNAEKSVVQAVRSKPLEQLSPEVREKLPEMDLSDPYQRGMSEAIFSDHAHGGMVVDAFVRAQTLWDETMAESVANYLRSPQGEGRHMLVVAGGNHVAHGYGIPRRVFRRLPVSYLIVGGLEISVATGKDVQTMDVELPKFPMVRYDFLNFLSYEKLPESMKLGVVIEPAPAGGLLVKSVAAGSNAERSGIKESDRLLAMDGEKLVESLDLVYAVRQKRPGDRVKLQVARGEETMEIEVVLKEKGKGEKK